MRWKYIYFFLGFYVLGYAFIWSHLTSGQDLNEFGSCSLAFGILVSRTDWQSFPRLFTKIFDENSLYCIHFDGKLNSSVKAHLRAVIGAVSRRSLHTPVILQSRNVTYRGISHTLTLLDLIECAFQSSAQWRFWLNLSGSDYPLLSIQSIRQLLCNDAPPNSSYLSLSARSPNPDIYARWQLLHVDPSLSRVAVDNLQRLSTGHPFFPPNIPVLKGSDWFIFSKALSEWILRSSQGRWLLAYFANTASTSESYFHTLIAASDHEFVADNLRFSLWGSRNDSSGQHPWLLDSATYWKSVQQSAALFARKFTADSPLLDLIDDQMHRGCYECEERARGRLLAKPISRTELRAINLLPRDHESGGAS